MAANFNSLENIKEPLRLDFSNSRGSVHSAKAESFCLVKVCVQEVFDALLVCDWVDPEAFFMTCTGHNP